MRSDDDNTTHPDEIKGASKDCPPVNVLIVEDDLIMGELLRDSLETDGFHVTGLVRNVDEAMISAAQNHNDFAIIDLHLAKGDLGVEVARRLRGISHLGIIFSTGNDDHNLTIDNGDAVMMKPYRMREITRGLRIIAEIKTLGASELPLPRHFRLLGPASSLSE